jgi:FkbH-like protein
MTEPTALHWVDLRRRARQVSTYRESIALDRQLTKWRKAQTPTTPRRQARIALVGSSTLDFLAPALRVACCAVDIDATVWVGDYGQFRQNILHPPPALDDFSPTVVIIATEWHALNLANETTDPSGFVTSFTHDMRGLWHQCRQRWGAQVIQHGFDVPMYEPYGYLSATLPGGRAHIIRQLNLALTQAAQTESGVAMLDVEQIAGEFGKTRWSDPVLWHAAKQTPSHDALPTLAQHQAVIMQAMLGLSAKCLVLDLDDTLWGGVIGEDGLTGIKLGGDAAGEAFVAFQHYCKSLNQRGIVLAVNSKNNEADALLPFEQHREMILKRDDFAVFLANWQTKDQNLRTIAKTLNIGLDSLVFVDNSPIERNWVRQQLPDVIVPELPDDPAGYIAALHNTHCFEILSLTDDDRRRANTYRENVARATAQTSALDIESYLQSLEMVAELRPFDELDLPRVTQLINKTNQFNLTTRRVTSAQVQQWMENPDVYTQTIRLRDKFGDNGLISVLIGIQQGGEMHIHTWLMSCRVLGRRVEETAIALLQHHALDRACSTIIGEYIPTAKNAMVADLFDRMGFTLTAQHPDGRKMYQLDTLPKRPPPTGIQIVDHTNTGLPIVSSEIHSN